MFSQDVNSVRDTWKFAERSGNAVKPACVVPNAWILFLIAFVVGAFACLNCAACFPRSQAPQSSRTWLVFLLCARIFLCVNFTCVFFFGLSLTFSQVVVDLTWPGADTMTSWCMIEMRVINEQRRWLHRQSAALIIDHTRFYRLTTLFIDVAIADYR